MKIEWISWKTFLFWKRIAFPEIRVPHCDTYPWVVSISSFVWLMIILRFQFFCSIYTVWNFQNYACYFFIWPNHKYILEQFLIIIDSSLLWIYFDAIFIMNNPLWTINRHFLHMYALVLFLHLICSNWPNWTPKLRWWWWISNFLPASYKTILRSNDLTCL